MAARWMTCVGRTRSKMASVALRSRKSPSFDDRKTHVASFSSSDWATCARMAIPYKPEPPVTMQTTLPLVSDILAVGLVFALFLDKLPHA